jgi:hypothetical protein
MPSVRCSRVLIVTGKARVRTDFLICAMLDAMAGHPSSLLIKAASFVLASKASSM